MSIKEMIFMKKRKTALLLALTMLFGSVGSVGVSARDIEETPAVAAEDVTESSAAIKPEFTYLYWSPDNGVGWTVDYDSGKHINGYVLELYKNGSLIKTYDKNDEKLHWGEWWDMRVYGGTADLSDIMEQDKTAEYTCKIVALGDGINTVDSDAAELNEYIYHNYDENSVIISANNLIQITNMNSASPFEWEYEYDHEYLSLVSRSDINDGFGLDGGRTGEITNFKAAKSGDTEIRFDLKSPYTGVIYESKLYKLHIDDALNVEAKLADPNADFVFGDADADGRVTASDAAQAMQKTLDSSYIMPIEKETKYYMEYIDVDRDFQITASDCAMIMQKVYGESMVMPAESYNNNYKSQYTKVLSPEKFIISRWNNKEYFDNYNIPDGNKSFICTSKNDIEKFCKENYVSEEKLNELLVDSFGENYIENRDIVFILTELPSFVDKMKLKKVTGEYNELKVELDVTEEGAVPDALDNRIVAFDVDKGVYDKVFVTRNFAYISGNKVYNSKITW